MVKAINRELDEPVTPSFLLEVMAQVLVRSPLGATRTRYGGSWPAPPSQTTDDWPDPAGLGPDVNASMSGAEKQQAGAALREALAIAEEAIRLEDDGQERAAVEEWRRLFGWRMPRP